ADVLLQLNGFIGLPPMLLRVSARTYEADPRWGPVLASLWARPKDWFDAFRETLGDIMNPPEEAEAGDSEGEDAEPDGAPPAEATTPRRRRKKKAETAAATE
ncbi:MAG: hypothetical protein NTZ05_01870, partial [Chloroflexi bacterium]|nr:hypothetical protein [Chloroflexota bacterium]